MTEAPDEAFGGTPSPRSRRLLFNALVLGSAFLAFVAYLGVLYAFRTTIGRPYVDAAGQPIGVYDIDVDGPPFAPVLPCCAPVLLLPVINLLYLAIPRLSSLLALLLPPSSPLLARRRILAWWALTLPLCLAPWAIPLTHLTLCLFFPAAYDHTPIRLP